MEPYKEDSHYNLELSLTLYDWHLFFVITMSFNQIKKVFSGAIQNQTRMFNE